MNTPFALWMNFLCVKIIYNTVLWNVFHTLSCKNCVYLGIYDFFHMLQSLGHTHGSMEYVCVCRYYVQSFSLKLPAVVGKHCLTPVPLVAFSCCRYLDVISHYAHIWHLQSCLQKSRWLWSCIWSDMLCPIYLKFSNIFSTNVL
jgi:hypothetical protein